MLADAHAATPLPMLLIRADTLAVTPDMLADASRALVSGEPDAAFGPTSRRRVLAARPAAAGPVAGHRHPG